MADPRRPLTSAQARKRRRIAATEPPPEPGPRPAHTLFVTSDRHRPPRTSVSMTLVATSRDSTTWRLDLEIAGTTAGVPDLPRAERRVLTPSLRRRVRRMREPEPFRPAWAAQTFTPARGPVRPRQRLFHRDTELDPLLVFPPDGRFVYKDQGYPWRCVGRIVVPGGIGSGVLVGPRHVLTASHVINWSALVVQFTAGLFDDSNMGTSGASFVWSYEKISDVNSDSVERDYVVIVLNLPLGQTLGWLGTREYWDSWDDEPYWSSIGYASDIGGMDRPVFQDDIVLEEEDGGDMMVMTTTTGDFVSMQSGSPVFGWWPKGPYAVGVASGAAKGMNWIGAAKPWSTW